MEEEEEVSGVGAVEEDDSLVDMISLFPRLIIAMLWEILIPTRDFQSAAFLLVCLSVI